MLALTLLGVLVAADSSGDVTTSIFATGLPERLLQDLVDIPHKAFYQVMISRPNGVFKHFGHSIKERALACCALSDQ